MGRSDRLLMLTDLLGSDPVRVDEIVDASQRAARDPRPDALDLTVGGYRDALGRTPMLGAVSEAASRLLGNGVGRAYLPLLGGEGFGAAVRGLVLGAEDDAAVSIPAPGGTGALRLALELWSGAHPRSTAWVSAPGYPNHAGLAESAHLDVRHYPYGSHGVAADLDGMHEALARAAPHDLIVVQGCCHNPTGVDLTPAQWEQFAVAAARRPVLVVVDLAYQGFGSGLEPDRAAVDALLRAGAAFVVCVSFSKNMALYGERAGALLVPGPRLGAAVESRLAAAARRLWSSAPRLASELVAEILSTTSLRARWQTELELMAARVADIRERLAHQLATDAVPVDTDGLLAQRGLFWWSGLDRGVIARLRERHGIHVLDNGRVNLAAVPEPAIGRVGAAIAAETTDVERWAPSPASRSHH